MALRMTSSRSAWRPTGRLLGLLAGILAIVAASPAAMAASRSHGRHACCHVAAGTPVRVELVDQVGSATQKTGDNFALRLAAPVVVDGMVVLRAGTPGVGQVIQSDGPGIGGKPGKMVLAARYLTVGDRRVPLSAFDLAAPGRNNARAAQVIGLSGFVFAPLTFVGIVVPGGNVEFHAGTVAGAKVASAITLPPLGRATSAEITAAASAGADEAQAAAGPIAIPPPPTGEGQVVFFRAKSLLTVGQWFNVREDGDVVVKLTNGSYFIHATSPGEHTYTAKLEPELKDRLTINVDAGETYFVEGVLTGGLVLSAADLTPSTRARFEKSAKDLKPAATPSSAAANTQAPPS